MEDDDEAQITKNISVFAHKNGCPPQSPPATFLEVLCRGEEKIRRFASGTKAGFALHRINRKLAVNMRAATCIEAVKDGEDPVEFGPDAELVIYGPGWRLQTLHEQDLDFRPVNSSLYRNQSKQNPSEFYPTSKVKRRSNSKFTVWYFAKIALAFCFVFFLAGTFILILENLPQFLSYLQA